MDIDVQWQFELDIDGDAHNVGITLAPDASGALCVSNANENSVCRFDFHAREVVALYASEPFDTSVDAIRGPCRCVLLDATTLLVAEFGARAARIVHLASGETLARWPVEDGAFAVASNGDFVIVGTRVTAASSPSIPSSPTSQRSSLPSPPAFSPIQFRAAPTPEASSEGLIPLAVPDVYCGAILSPTEPDVPVAMPACARIYGFKINSVMPLWTLPVPSTCAIMDMIFLYPNTIIALPLGVPELLVVSGIDGTCPAVRTLELAGSSARLTALCTLDVLPGVVFVADCEANRVRAYTLDTGACLLQIHVSCPAGLTVQQPNVLIVLGSTGMTTADTSKITTFCLHVQQQTATV